jgi:arylsulfatase
MAILCIFLLSLSSCGEDATPRTDPRPNVIIILADDMGYSDLGCMGSEIQTPNLDRLAGEGVLFTQFYNCTKCTPSRGALLTGMYPHTSGVGSQVRLLDQDRPAGPYQGFLHRDSVLTLAELLRHNGYRTIMSGKWHLGEAPEHWPVKRGFDRYFGLISGASSYYKLIRENNPFHRIMAEDSTEYEPPQKGFYMTDAFTDFALEQVGENRDRPFFLYLAYTAPHWPLHAPEENIARYRGRYDQGWEALRRERLANMKEKGFPFDTLAPKPASVLDFDRVDQKSWSALMEVHAAMVDRLDENIGRLLQELERIGQLENTLIYFLSDNGASSNDVRKRGLDDPMVPVGAPGSYRSFMEPWAMAANTPLRDYKLKLYEGGIRSPLIVFNDPRLKPGTIDHQSLVHIADITPTVMSLLDAQKPEGTLPFEGIDFPNADSLESRTLFWEYNENFAIREGRYKLALDRDSSRWMLFDMQEDPIESRNIIEELPERADSLENKWVRWALRTGVFSEK